MSEIAWLVKLMTSYKLPDEVREFCIARIGEVEEKMSSRPSQSQISHSRSLSQGEQSPSTLAKMAEHAQTHPVTPLPPSAAIAIQRSITPVEVNTGNGTRGPRKF